MTSTMNPLLYTHIKLRGYAFRCAKIWWYFAHFLHTHAQSVRTQQWLIVDVIIALGAILIVYIPIRQCARDLICDLMIRDVLVHRILQVHSHDPASPHILSLSRNTSRSSKIRGNAGDKMRGDTRCPVETRSKSNFIQTTGLWKILDTTPQVYYSHTVLSTDTRNIIYCQLRARRALSP